MSERRAKTLKVGQVEHIITGGSCIVRLETSVRVGQEVFDSVGRPIGTIKDIIGNVKKPYALVSYNSSQRRPARRDPIFSRWGK